MAELNPPHRRILARAPQPFQLNALAWDLPLEASLEHVPAPAHNLFRTLVIGSLALTAAEAEPEEWSRDTVDFAGAAVDTARQALPAEQKALARETIAAIMAGAEWRPAEALKPA